MEVGEQNLGVIKKQLGELVEWLAGLGRGGRSVGGLGLGVDTGGRGQAGQAGLSFADAAQKLQKAGELPLQQRIPSNG